MRFLAAVLAVPVLAGRLAALERPLASSSGCSRSPRASPAAPVAVDCQSFWGGLLDAQAREGEVYFDASGRPEAKLFLTRPTCQRLRVVRRRTATTTSSTASRSDRLGTPPTHCRSTRECYARSAGDDLRRSSSSRTRATTRPASRDEAHGQLLRDPGDGLDGDAARRTRRGRSRSCSRVAMAALEPRQGRELRDTNECRRAASGFDLHPETPDFPTEHPHRAAPGGRVRVHHGRLDGLPAQYAAPVILDNGVIRTLDPSLPTCGALAIAGPIVAGGVGTHEWMLPTPERVDLARPLRAARVHRLARPLPDLVARAARRAPRGGRLGRRRARARRRRIPRRGTWIRGTGWRDAAWPDRPTAAALDAVTGDDAGRAVVEGLPLALAQHRRPRARRAATSRCPAASSSATPTAQPTGILREESAWRFRDRFVTVTEDEWVEATREGIRVANARGVGGDPRQGRLARRRLDLRPDPRAAKGCRCASGSRSRPTGCRSSRRCRCARASATTSSASAT